MNVLKQNKLQEGKSTMSENTTRNENSRAWVSGRLETNLEYSYQVALEHFYKARVEVVRQSGTIDYVPIHVSEQLLDGISHTTLQGKYVEVGGSFRSINQMGADGKRHMQLYLLATTFIVHFDESDIEEHDANSIFLDGYICKEPVCRTTPFGRTITDFMLKVNLSYKKSSYIPCIAWSRAALYASKFQVGDRVQLYGRIQSREYQKIISDSTYENRIAYEVSVQSLAKVSE